MMFVSPQMAVLWVLATGFFTWVYMDQSRLTEMQGWGIFIALAPAPLAPVRFWMKEHNNIFDWVGYVAAGIGFLLTVKLITDDHGMNPFILPLAVICGIFPALGLYGLFGLPAFAFDAMPKPPDVRATHPARRTQPYSVPDNGGAYGFDLGSYGGRQGGGAYGQNRLGGFGFEDEHGNGGQPRRPLPGAGGQTPPPSQCGDCEYRRQPEPPQHAFVHVVHWLAGKTPGGQKAEPPGYREPPRNSGPRPPPAGRAVARTADAGYRDDLDIMGLSDGFTLDQLQTRYRDLAKRTHTDTGGTDPLFRQVHAAYDRLRKRAR